MTDKQIIIEDCPYFVGGNCQEYLDGVCKNHKCDLKIIRELEQKLKAKEQECDKLKSYYKLYRIETDRVKKVQAVINSNPKYGIEFTEDDIIVKDERIASLEVHEQVKLIIDEQAKELDQLKAENEELKKKIKYMEEYIKTVENSRNEFEKESKFLKEEIQKL